MEIMATVNSFSRNSVHYLKKCHCSKFQNKHACFGIIKLIDSLTSLPQFSNLAFVVSSMHVHNS